MTVDLDAYFERIGYTGPRRPTLETLQSLHLQHTQTIPFENLDPLSGRPVRLDPASLERKLIHERRGGYCFEHNLLFSNVLQQLGFTATGLAARVVYNAPEGVIRPRGHMLLRVDLSDGPHIADVGFGGLTLTGPLRLAADVVQSTPHEPFRIVVPAERERQSPGPEFMLQVQIRDTWSTLYRFDLQPQLAIDYESPNWYLSTYPESRFVTNLLCARPLPGKRFALADNRLTIHHLNGGSEHQILASTAEIRDALRTKFGVHLLTDSALDAAIDRLFHQ